MKAVVAAFYQEKALALAGAFSVITHLRMELFEALVPGARLRPTCGWRDDLATSNLLRCGGGQKEVISTKSLCNFCVNY